MKLTELVPPPEHPVDPPTPQDFAACEADLGLVLPSDFKQLLSAYGNGRFLDYLFTYTVSGSGMDMRHNRYLVEENAGLREEFPEDYPYPLYPEAGGLVVWGRTDVGHELCWLTEGEPDDWPVVVWRPRDLEYQLYKKGGAVKFLTKWLEGELKPKYLPRPQPIGLWFEPARKLKEVYVYLDGGDGDFGGRLRILRGLLGPVKDRGSHHQEDHDEDHFATVRDWRVSYSQWPLGRLIRIAFPAAEEDAARAAVFDAIPKLGHVLRHVQTVSGKKVWKEP